MLEMKITSVTLIIALVTIANGNSTEKFRVGDTVYVSKKDRKMNLKVSDIFNGFGESEYIKAEVMSSDEYTISYNSCLLFEFIKNIFYPDVLVAENVSISATSNVFSYRMSKWENKSFGIKNQYINNEHFRYGVVKICKASGKEILIIDLINTPDFPKNDRITHYNILPRRTVVFRLRQNNETHYVSSITTGTCLVQIYVNDVAKCTSKKARSTDDVVDFFESSIIRSPIMTVDMDSQLANKINQYYFVKNIEYSLFTFPDENKDHKNNILEMFENNEIVSIRLCLLPEIPASARFSPTQISYPLETSKKQDDIIPGDILSLNDVLNSTLELVITRNVLISQADENKLPSIYYNYSSCLNFSKNAAPNFENGKLNVFDEMLKRQNHGVFPEFVDVNMTCMRMVICSKLTREKLYSPMAIIKLDDNSKNNRKYNIFEDENILLWSSRGNEDHLVTHVERGECLSQTIMYIDDPNTYDRSFFDISPIYKGKIFSATGNSTLEERVKNFVMNDFRNIVGKVKNASAVIQTFEELGNINSTNYAVINLYLEKLI